MVATMTTFFDDVWQLFDEEKAVEMGTPPPTVEFFGTIVMPENILDGCPGQLVELTAMSVNGVVRHEAVIRLLEKRGIHAMGSEVTVDCENWRDA